jgi:hypothetical protein
VQTPNPIFAHLCWQCEHTYTLSMNPPDFDLYPRRIQGFFPYHTSNSHRAFLQPRGGLIRERAIQLHSQSAPRNGRIRCQLRSRVDDAHEKILEPFTKSRVTPRPSSILVDPPRKYLKEATNPGGRVGKKYARNNHDRKADEPRLWGHQRDIIICPKGTRRLPLSMIGPRFL